MFDRWCWLSGHTEDVGSTSFKTRPDSEWCRNGIRRVLCFLSESLEGWMPQFVHDYVREVSCQLTADF